MTTPVARYLLFPNWTPAFTGEAKGLQVRHDGFDG